MRPPAIVRPDGVWVEVDRAALGEVRDPLPKEFRAYRLDLSALTKILATAPPESTGSGAPPDPVQMFIPLPDGTFAPVAVKQSPVVGGELELQYPGITTFAFNGTQDGAISGRATLTGTSFQAILRPPSDFARVTPLTTSTGTFYLSFLHRDRTDGADDFRHRHDHPREPVPVPAATHAQSHDPESHSGSPLFEVLGLQVGGTLRQFRLAAAATGEYYQAMAGPNGATDVFNAIVAEVNNANMVFEAEFSIRMVLTVAILYLDPSNDPYSTVAFDEACTTRQENVAAINNVIDAADYDIGFAFNQGTGFGCAWYVVCLADKARGAGLINTALTPGSSTGLLAHEMAHQLGARQTFSTNTGSCGNPGEFNQPSAFEPGSGSTISSYLGACAPNNVDTDVSTGAVPAGFYYHARTFEEIISNITSGSGTCGSSSAVGNSAPAVMPVPITPSRRARLSR
ncbi:MAG TPA: zinc-dependent metalloprotease family protein [Vicinamibacterales bacterium]|nr:zinc-dependent metalloprotease family protein [Vicinamibacterales bacterium]